MLISNQGLMILLTMYTRMKTEENEIKLRKDNKYLVLVFSNFLVPYNLIHFNKVLAILPYNRRKRLI